jgi:oligopeptide/dipeptide ABC transporter ATP-binding protein
VELIGLTVSFPGRAGRLPVVRGVDLCLSRGETLGLVGESGSGKTMLGLSLLQLVPEPGEVTGSVRIAGREMVGASERQLRAVRGTQVAMVFQDPMTGLNPVRTIGSLLVESIRRHQGRSAVAARELAVQALRRVGVPAAEERMRAYPHMLSGGLRQRAMIALALANSPAVLVADEPTTALDATIQAQLLEVLRDCATDSAVILITHDLGVAAEVCDRIAVLYAGRIVEIGPTASLLNAPRHPYTRGLLAARPRFDARRVPLRPIPGQPPPPDAGLAGCRFAPRCPLAVAECVRDEPTLRPVGDVEVACVRAEHTDG